MHGFTTQLLRLAFAGAVLLQPVAAREITIFDKRGEAVAYIDTSQDNTIYLWDGQPVAFLRGENVYENDGKHLGQLKNGRLNDHDGNCVGVLEGATSMLTQIPSIKGIKGIRPIRGIPEIPPIPAIPSMSWSRMPLELWLSAGTD